LKPEIQYYESNINTPATIIGQWESVAHYALDDSGNYGWYSQNGWSERISFLADGSFSIYTDVPSGSGTYSFEDNSNSVTLNYRADQYGNTAHTVTFAIEDMSNKELTLAVPDAPQKTTYSKID